MARARVLPGTPIAAAGLLAAGGCAAPPPPDPAAIVAEALELLGNGEIEAASAQVAAARARCPQHGGLAVCSATIADLLWQDERAIAELKAVLASDDRGGWTLAGARGRLGDQLFQAGRYGEALVPLLAGAVDEDAARRRALVAVVRELPFRRKQAGPLATELPLLEGDLTEVVCSIGALRRPFAIDTGSSMTTLGTALAAVGNVRAATPAGEVPDGTGRPVPVSLGVLDDFAVGDVWLGTVPVLVVDDNRLAMRDLFGGPVRAPTGVLGLDLLGQFRMTIDPGRRSVVFELPRGLPAETSVQCVRAEGRCLVPVAIEGRRLWFVLDTGASHSSLTFAGLARLPGGAPRATPGFRRVRTAGGGALSVREVRNLVLRVSQTRFSGVDLPVIDRRGTGAFPVHGVLGVDLLRQSRLTLDRGRVRLEPRP